ncbi:MAG: RsiV family protein [Eubacteriales bacterium]
MFQSNSNLKGKPVYEKSTASFRLIPSAIEMRHILLLLLIMVSTLILISCGSINVGPNNLKSPIEIPYLLKNPIEITSIENNDVTEFYTRTISLKGLKDKKIEGSINEDLLNAYDQISNGELPPIRGIKKDLGSTSKLTGNTLDAQISFNYNNVASVVVYGNRTYNQSVYVGLMDALNFDLNTGKQISLKDIFADDVDYKIILNDYISAALAKGNATEEDYYSMSGNDLKLVSPFKGISDNQKFYLSQAGLVLIFDYSNPEFDTGLYASTIYINFQELGDIFAIAKRFYDPNVNIYTSEKPVVKEFLQSWGGTDIRSQENRTLDKINITQSLVYNPKIPVEAVEKATSLGIFDISAFNDMKTYTNTSGEDWNSFEQYVWANSVGTYSVVSKNLNIYYNGKWKTSLENYNYDKSGKLLALHDIFVPGYDYKSLVVNSMKAAIKQIPVIKTYDTDQLYNNLSFAIGISEISFSTIPMKTDPLSESPVYFSVTYEEFGCDNMTIFNQVD